VLRLGFAAWEALAVGVGAPAGTVTFLFTDIEGSTRLWQSVPEAMRLALQRHDLIVRAAIEAHGGYVFSRAGDGFAAAFARAGDALAAATGAQSGLGVERWPDGATIRVRMGVHSGEVEERGGDYFGTAVNRAARLMAVGHGGQVLMSAVTAGLVEGDVEVTDLGEHRLRDLERPMRVFQVGPGGFEPLRSLDGLPGNLPSLASSFVGRRKELAAVAKELGTHRLVTLTGTGGVGKTRLALQVAAELAPRFADGAWICELAAAADAHELAQVVAIALGVVQRQHMSLVGSIVDFLRTRELLVVLDNCEHLLNPAAGLAQSILAGAPGVRILATSREGLAVPEEHVRPLRPLTVAGDVASALTGEAVVLFGERARAVDPDFTLDEASAPAVIEICRRLDGIPLAIELAAARLASMGPAEIAGHLDERFRLLTGGRRGRVERHQTLRSAVEWSYSLLDSTDRAVFDRVGVFPTSFDEAAALAVCTDVGIERWDVIDALASLVAKSMVAADVSGGTTRYQLLETLRHFAREMAGDLDGLRRRHAAHYAAFAERAGAGLVSPDELAWRSRVSLELDNLRSAAGWALNAANRDDMAIGVAILDGLMSEVFIRPSSGIGAWADPAVVRVDELDAARRSAVLAAAAHAAFWAGRFDQAGTLGREAIIESDTPTLALMVAVEVVGLCAAASGDPGEAASVLTAGRRRFQIGLQAEWSDCTLQTSASYWFAAMGDLGTARSEAQQAVSVARRLESPSLLANALAAQADALAATNPDEALRAADEAIGLVEAGAGDISYTVALQAAATLRAAQGDTPRAARALHAGVEHETRVGNRFAAGSWAAVAVNLLARTPETLQAAATVAGALSGPVLAQLSPLIIGNSRDNYESALRSIAAALSGDTLEKARQHGAAMTYDEITAYTLHQLDRLANR